MTIDELPPAIQKHVKNSLRMARDLIPKCAMPALHIVGGNDKDTIVMPMVYDHPDMINVHAEIARKMASLYHATWSLFVSESRVARVNTKLIPPGQTVKDVVDSFIDKDQTKEVLIFVVEEKNVRGRGLTITLGTSDIVRDKGSITVQDPVFHQDYATGSSLTTILSLDGN